MLVDGKVALITGGARGLGRGYAEELLRKGAKVFLTDVLDERGEETARELAALHGEERVTYQHADVTDKQQLSDAFDSAIKLYGGLDLVINNAGVNPSVGLRKTFDINLFGLMNGTELALERMRTDIGGTGRGGVLINVCSVSGLYGMPGGFPYQASKHAVLVYSRGLAALLGETSGVRLGIVCPATVRTEMTEFAFSGQLTAKQQEQTDYCIQLGGGLATIEDVVCACMVLIERDDLGQGATVRAAPNKNVLQVFPENAPTKPLF